MSSDRLTSAVLNELAETLMMDLDDLRAGKGDPLVSIQSVADNLRSLADVAADSRPSLAGAVSTPEHLYQKCDHCHLFVERNEDAECLGCKHSGTTLHEWGPVITGPSLVPHQVCVFCKQTRQPLYEHSHRHNAVDLALDESHEAAPSGRWANLLAWQTYGPLAMRERFTS